MSKPLPTFEDLCKITVEDINNLRDSCLETIKAGELYELRNDAKLRAVNSTKSYEEFKGIVDAAHLRSITRQDKSSAKTRTRLWNTTAREELSNRFEDSE